MLEALLTQAALQHVMATITVLLGAALIYALLRLLLHRIRPENPDRTGNGIGAGTIKIYDNRFLSIRLDELEANLEKLGAIDSAKLDDSIGVTQGKIASGSDIGIAANAASDKAEAAAAADPKDSSKGDGADAKPAPSALDRLSELINLRYEILSLRMILERSLSDRLWHEGKEDDARLQAVLGLQVSLDPPAEFAGCAAVVEVTFKETSDKPVSLVALLPQERTSNMLFAGSQSQTASGSNETGGRRMSFSWRRRLETVSSVREPDTVAFQRPAHHEAPVSLTVGWQFRPPLDRPAVLAGVRQVFAILALPAIDKTTGVAGVKPQINVEAAIRTYWRRYNPKTRTTSPRWGLLPWRLASGERRQPQQPVDVSFTYDIQEQLKPRVSRIRTTLLGSQTVVVMVDGINFFPGTTVAIGGSVHRDLQSGLLIKSDYHFQVTTTPKAVASGNGIINGRYGPTALLKIPTPIPSIWVAWCEVELSPDAKFHELNITVACAEKDKVFTESELSKLPEPIVTVDDQVLPPPYYWTNSYRQSVADDGYASESQSDGKSTTLTNCVVLTAWVPAQWNPLSARFKLIFPFCGDEYQHAFGITEYEPAFAINHWARANTHCLLITATGGEFEKLDRWSVELDRIYALSPPDPFLSRLSETQLLLEVPADALDHCDHLIVRWKESDATSVYPLQIPPLAPPPKPTLENKTIEISSASDNFVKIAGTLLEGGGKVRLTRPGETSAVDLLSSVSADRGTLTIHVPKGQAIGFAELVVETKEKAELGRIPVIVKE